jgi:thymidylate kinase
MLKRGQLYVFEGPDGVGKSTLSKGIADRLNATGIIGLCKNNVTV